jgi:hypothetical protein
MTAMLSGRRKRLEAAGEGAYSDFRSTGAADFVLNAEHSRVAPGSASPIRRVQTAS